MEWTCKDKRNREVSAELFLLLRAGQYWDGPIVSVEFFLEELQQELGKYWEL